MPDRENVINGLKAVGGYLDMKSYTDNIAFNLIPHIKAAIALLKEQEAVKPFSDDDGGYWCSSCHEDIVWHQKFCSNCGRPVLWESR